MAFSRFARISGGFPRKRAGLISKSAAQVKRKTRQTGTPYKRSDKQRATWRRFKYANIIRYIHAMTARSARPAFSLLLLVLSAAAPARAAGGAGGEEPGLPSSQLEVAMTLYAGGIT